MPFRFAIGSASCKGVSKSNTLESKICEMIQEKISVLRTMDFSNLKHLSEENTVDYEIEGKAVMLTVFKKELDSDRLLLVVQTAYKTFKFPNYITLGFIGKVLVDGVIINNKNESSVPDDQLLWEFK